MQIKMFPVGSRFQWQRMLEWGSVLIDAFTKRSMQASLPLLPFAQEKDQDQDQHIRQQARQGYGLRAVDCGL
jgi:hypothetical protein